MSRKLLSQKQVAKKLGIKDSFAGYLLRKNEIRGIKVGKFWRTHPDELAKYIECNTNSKVVNTVRKSPQQIGGGQVTNEKIYSPNALTATIQSPSALTTTIQEAVETNSTTTFTSDNIIKALVGVTNASATNVRRMLQFYLDNGDIIKTGKLINRPPNAVGRKTFIEYQWTGKWSKLRSKTRGKHIKIGIDTICHKKPNKRIPPHVDQTGELERLRNINTELTNTIATLEKFILKVANK